MQSAKQFVGNIADLFFHVLSSAQDLSRKQRNHNFVVSGNRETASRTVCGWTSDDVCGRAVMLYKIEIRRGEILQRKT